MRWWTLELDIVLRDNVAAGKAWLDIAASLHMTRDQVARRAFRLGLKRGMAFQDGDFLQRLQAAGGDTQRVRNRRGRLEMLALGDSHSLERALEAAKAGYDMIGFDVSTLPLEKNIELTRALADFAKLVELFDEHD